MKPRKFSFDIPRLKIGPSKADNKALRDHLNASAIDSPPPTPKSVRPPLSPLIEAELRSACTYVLQNFKPSHIQYEEQYGGAQKQQLDYAAIKESVHREMEQSAPPLSKVTSRTREEVAVTEDEEAEMVSSTKFSYRPDTATEDLFRDDDAKAQRRSAMLRAEQLMSAKAAKSATLNPNRVSGTHLRSVSNPSAPTLAPPKPDILERPRTALRTDSMETTGSTPQTDTTDYPWSEKASTAMTSAAVTPARSSKRTSSQALHAGSESGSVPTVEPVEGDWMRQELEKHKKAHEERLQQERKGAEDEEKAESVTETTPTQSSTHTATPVAARIPARKPVPHSRNASRQESERSTSRQDSRVSSEQIRQVSLGGLIKDIPTGPVRHEAQYAPPPSRQAPRAPAAERPPSRARSISRKVKEYVQPGSTHTRQESNDVQRPPSRARSISRKVRDYVRAPSAHGRRESEDLPRPSSRAGHAARQVKEYFKPEPVSGNRKPSMDIERPMNRKRSMDSFRTAASEFAHSASSSADRWRSWRPQHRQQASRNSEDVSRPGTSGSVGESRGRSASRENKHSPQQASHKPAVNLNRDLPPLPGLDQWKDEKHEEPQEPPKVGSAFASPAATMTPLSHRSQHSRQEKPAVAVEPEIGERDEILAARMGSPAPSGRKPSLDIRIPPQPSAPPPAPPLQMSATFSSRDDFDYEHLSPTGTVEPSSAKQENKHERRRSKTIEVGYPADFHAKMKENALSQTAAPRPVFTGKATLVNYSRPAGGPIKGGLSRKVSTAAHSASTTSHTPLAHSRNVSDYESRNTSTDATARMHDGSFQNMVEITASKTAPQTHSPAVPSPAKLQSKSKWWQRKKEGRDGKSGSWMDQVVKSGSRSGVMLTDDSAGAPIVRY